MECLRGGDQFTPFAVQVFLGNQAFDDGRPGRRGAESASGHGGAHFFVIQHLSGTLHRGEQRGFVEACGWARLVGLDIDGGGVHRFIGSDRNQRRAVFIALAALAIDRQPTRLDENLAFCLEGVGLDMGDPAGDQILG